jgi:hypothetical protein
LVAEVQQVQILEAAEILLWLEEMEILLHSVLMQLQLAAVAVTEIVPLLLAVLAVLVVVAAEMLQTDKVQELQAKEILAGQLVIIEVEQVAVVLLLQVQRQELTQDLVVPEHFILMEILMQVAAVAATETD